MTKIEVDKYSNKTSLNIAIRELQNNRAGTISSLDPLIIETKFSNDVTKVTQILSRNRLKFSVK